MFQITGNTYIVKDTLRAIGCRWNSQAKAWETGNPATAAQAAKLVTGIRVNGTMSPTTERKVTRTPRPKVVVPDVRIEYPAQGRTYCSDEYGVYSYGVYPASSVLAGQQSRQFLGMYPTLAEAQAAHPEASTAGCGYIAPNLNHLPLED